MKRQWKKLLASGLVAAVAAFALVGCGGGASGYDADTPVADQVDKTIQGIDPGAGIMQMTTEALTDYGLADEGWTLSEASDSAMMAELEAAYKKEAPIIITGWTPHWMFEAFDLKYLDDPKGSYGKAEKIETLVRQGLKEDEPAAYEFLDRFNWEPADMEKVMNDTRDSSSEEAAQKWIEDNADKVDAWAEGLEKQDGSVLKIAYVAWDSETATSNVVKAALEDRLGYTVELVQLDVGPMYASLAQGDSDAMVSAWLPSTHEKQYAKFGDQIENLGPNLEGTRLGMVVPTYMENVNSIEDLLA